MSMGSRALAGVIALCCLLVGGCAQRVVGTGAAGVTQPEPSRLIGELGSGAVARTTELLPTTNTVTPSVTTQESPRSVGLSTVTSAETITAYTTIYEDVPAEPGPDAVNGPLDLGPNEFGFVTFQSPSSNIMCGIFADPNQGGVRCDIGEWTFSAPPPQDCGALDYRGGIAQVGPDGAGQIGACASDTLADRSNPVLGYGQTAGAGRYACVSAEDGVTCANIDTGHGFRVAKASYQVF